MAQPSGAESVLPHLHLVAIGHAKSGKSTLLGRLLADLNALPAWAAERVERVGQLRYAEVWDRLDSERQREMTLDMHDAPCKTKKFRWTLVDVPGHRRYLRNTLTGLSCADAVLFVVDATPGVFETHMEDNCLEEGVNAQTKEQLMLLVGLGVKQIVVVANKMDACGYSQQRFDTICQELSTQMKRLNLAAEQTRFVPVSSEQGDNILQPSKINMPWFTGSTLIEALDSMTEPRRQVDKPLRIPIQQVHRVGGIGTVVCGKVEAGVLHEGSRVLLAPYGITATVKSIEMQQHTVDKACAGDSVGISLRGVSLDDVSRGMVVMPLDGPGPHVIKVVSFEATVSVRRSQGVMPGYIALLDIHAAHVPCRFARLTAKLDKKTGKVLEVNPSKLEDREVGTVEVEPLCPLFLETQKDLGPLGRFVVQDRHQVVAVGLVKSVKKCAVDCRSGRLERSSSHQGAL